MPRERLRLLPGPKHLLLPPHSLLPLRWGGHPALAATDPRTVRSSFRMASEASAVFQPTLGTSTSLWSRLLNRCPPSSEEAPPTGDQCGPWRAASQVPSSVRANPLFALRPVSHRYRHFRHRLVIFGSWVPSDIVRTGRDSRDPEATPASTFHHRHVLRRSFTHASLPEGSSKRL